MAIVVSEDILHNSSGSRVRAAGAHIAGLGEVAGSSRSVAQTVVAALYVEQPRP